MQEKTAGVGEKRLHLPTSGLVVAISGSAVAGCRGEGFAICFVLHKIVAVGKRIAF